MLEFRDDTMAFEAIRIHNWKRALLVPKYTCTIYNKVWWLIRVTTDRGMTEREQERPFLMQVMPFLLLKTQSLCEHHQESNFMVPFDSKFVCILKHFSRS